MAARTFRDASDAPRPPGAADCAALAAASAGADAVAALRDSLALGLRASYRHLAGLHLAAGSPARAAAMLLAAESLGRPA